MLRRLDASAHRSLTNMQRLAAPIPRLGEDLSGDWRRERASTSSVALLCRQGS